MEKAIVIKDFNNDQLEYLLNYLINRGYKWCHKELQTIGDIKYFGSDKIEVLYLDYTPYLLRYSTAEYLREHLPEHEVITLNDLQMKKQDIQLGMVVEYHCGKKALVISVNDEVLFSDTFGYMRLKDYNDDLTVIDRHDDSGKWDIDKVFKVTLGCSIDTMLSGNFLKLFWERQKEVELTMDEIAEKFGIPVKNLKIKK
jgi:hypothetical protein